MCIATPNRAIIHVTKDIQKSEQVTQDWKHSHIRTAKIRSSACEN